ncbi:MAG: RNA polymerase sigma factor RpoD/SigA [Gemmatimonadota bacterium]|nr:RNA polymerase sigma factor RpoD/SigA [Gemmatimonadota bacterium]
MTDIKKKIQTAIEAISFSDFSESAKDMLEVLGYQSDRTLELPGDVNSFIQAFPASRSNTNNERAFLEHVQSVKIIFQLTNDEIARPIQQSHRSQAAEFDEGRQQSILFFAVELWRDDYPRGIYDEFTREIDKRINAPAVVLFRAGDLFTIAVIGRRPHKLDDSLDVLERVTSLSREIPTVNPRHSDLDALADLSLTECISWMNANGKPRNFDGLLTAWLSKLDATERGQPFYRYASEWIERVESEGKLPKGEEITLRNYFNDIARSTPLSREREIELAERTENGDAESREALVTANLRFVIYMAKKYRNRGLPLSDLISAGNLGLVIAADRFDGARGNRFITYAVWWIRQSIIKSLEDHTRLVRLPLNKVSLLNKISRVLNQDWDSETPMVARTTELEVPSQDDLEEIAAELGLPVETVLDTITSGLGMLPLDNSPINHGSGLVETLVDENTAPPDAEIVRQSAVNQIDEALERLTSREAAVISLHYGLNGSDSHTLEEIGEMMNLTRERIRQIKLKAISRLRRWSRDLLEPEMFAN